ncbi:MAG: radical SAM protein [Planctomycetes bacterium]|nr:radical SAM protein [Planctomycetota bacterium]
MVGISRLCCGMEEPSDRLRYRPFDGPPRPVVVFNCTRRCNLRCAHCYSTSTDASAPYELTTDEARALIDDLAAMGAPVILFSGGEPMLRGDLLALIDHARQAGVRAVLSTNGTYITPTLAERFGDLALGYVGVSLDGLEATHDRLRGESGAFAAAMEGIRHCLTAGVKVGVRLTMTRRNAGEIPAVFDLIEHEGIPRVCFYHLVYAGRAAALRHEALDAAATRRALDTLIDRTRDLHARGRRVEVLTVDNHADGPYLVQRLAREDPDRARRAMELLRLNRGNASGERIAAVSWDGSVHPDPFWRTQTLGNVRQRPFSEIWTDGSIPLLAELRDRRGRLKGRCRRCRWLDVCNGNFRARAEAATGDRWADDPACYLTDEEIRPDAPSDLPPV